MPNWLFKILDFFYCIFFRSRIEKENLAIEEGRRARRNQRAERRLAADCDINEMDDVAKNDNTTEKVDVGLLHRERHYAVRGVLQTNQPLSVPSAIVGHPRYYRTKVLPPVSPRVAQTKKRHSANVYAYVECRECHNSATVLVYQPWSRSPYKGYWFHNGEVIELKDNTITKQIFSHIREEIEADAA